MQTYNDLNNQPSHLEVKEKKESAFYQPKSEDFLALNTTDNTSDSDSNYYDTRYQQELPSELRPYVLLPNQSAGYYYKKYSTKHTKTWYEIDLFPDKNYTFEIKPGFLEVLFQMCSFYFPIKTTHLK